MSRWTCDEMMTVAAARRLWNDCVCFVGIGLPSAACNLARLTHAPDIVLIYESGTLGTRPQALPLSIGDGELAETAACVVPLPEVFSYFLQAGRVDVGFLGAAQIDRHGNLNSTVIGPYDAPTTRLPGAGGAPEIAARARRTFVVLKATRRSFVDRLDFRTSAGYLEGHGMRAATTARVRQRPPSTRSPTSSPGGTEKAQKVHQLEHKGVEITRNIYEKLNESLITPLEPEEISRLAPVLDDVLDRIDRVTLQICTYGLTEQNDKLREFSYMILVLQPGRLPGLLKSCRKWIRFRRSKTRQTRLTGYTTVRSNSSHRLCSNFSRQKTSS